MNKPIKQRRTKAQIKQLSLLKAMRRYKALGYANKMTPIINQFIKDGLSQRAMAERLTLMGIQTASEWIEGKAVKTAQSTKVWTQTQVARLLIDVEKIKVKMEWYYKKAWAYKKDIFIGALDPLANHFTKKYYKISRHERKTSFEYYHEKMNDFRLGRMYKAGETGGMNTRDIAEEYRKFTKRKYYHKTKKSLITQNI